VFFSDISSSGGGEGEVGTDCIGGGDDSTGEEGSEGSSA